MNSLLLTVLCLLAFFSQTVTAIELHASNTVVGNMLAEPYLAVLASFLVLVLALI